MELFGPMELIISGWECQGFSTAKFGEGLSDTRSSLFTDIVRLITWAQSISPTLGYVIDNTPFQFDQRKKIQEHYTLVGTRLSTIIFTFQVHCKFFYSNKQLKCQKPKTHPPPIYLFFAIINQMLRSQLTCKKYYGAKLME